MARVLWPVRSMATRLLWPRRLAKYLPGLLVALVAGTVLSVLWLSDVSVIGAVPSAARTVLARIS